MSTPKSKRKFHGGNIKMLGLIKYACKNLSGNLSNKFGYLFGNTSEQIEVSMLENIANKMSESIAEEDPNIPIGFAFLGQFIDHDITLDITTELGKSIFSESSATSDKDKIEHFASQCGGSHIDIDNFRTPKLDLDSVYASGPEGSPFLYSKAKNGQLLTAGFNAYLTQTSPINHYVFDDHTFDFLRNIEGTAIIGDFRNDENLFINQLHLLFIRFHNYMLDKKEEFEKAKKIVTHTYQKIVIEEYLKLIIEPSVYNSYLQGLKNKSLPDNWVSAPSMPVEFSAAAFRFGHSQVRTDYIINDGNGIAGPLTMNIFDKVNGEVLSFRPIPKSHKVDWKYFFDIDGPTFKNCMRVDAKLSPKLTDLPDNIVASGGIKNLALRNLIRGQETFELMTGEEIAANFGVTPINIPESPQGKTPLWFYILKEAEGCGGKLGPVGGRLVCGTIMNMVLRDKESYINMDAGFDPYADNYIKPVTSGSLIAAVANTIQNSLA